MLIRFGVLFIALGCLLIGGGPSTASAGTAVLDPGFGVGGLAGLDLPEGSQGQAMAFQPDGKIVAVGEASNRLVIARFFPDGTLDTGFADDGVFLLEEIRRGLDIAVREDGKIIASGSGDNHLVRLNPDGTLDTSFASGITGSQFFNPDDPDETDEPDMVRLVLMPGDRTLAGGTIDYGPYFFTFALYDNEGHVIPSFGDEGQVQTDFSPPDDGLDQEPLALMHYGDDGFVAAGYRDVVGGDQESSVVARYKGDGTLHEGFADGGKATNDFFPGFEAIEEVFQLPDGRILAVGDGRTSDVDPNFDERLFLAQYDVEGTLHTDFGDNGRIIFEMPGTQRVEGAVLLPDGHIVVTGTDSSDQGSRTFFARFDENGVPDPAFGTDGWMFLEGLGFQVRDLAVDENGDVFAAGTATDGQVQLAVIKLSLGLRWGDVECSGAPGAAGALALLLFAEGLDSSLSSSGGECPDIGSQFGNALWGDIDCSGAIDGADAVAILAYVADVDYDAAPGCPPVGDPVALG